MTALPKDARVSERETQLCSLCQRQLPLDSFSPSRRGVGRAPCRACTADRDRQRNADLTPEQKAAKNARVVKWREEHPREYQDAELRRRYGITLEQYEAKLDEQRGVCAGCHQPETRKKITSDELCPLHVDHDHDTGRFRGLLCSGCNLILGHAHDNPKVLLGLLDYIEGWPE